MDALDVVGDFLIALATAVLAAVGAWLAHSYRRRMRFELAEARRAAYAALWEITGLAAPTRLDTAGIDGYLTKPERQELYQAMTDWYYKDGNGMLLEATTRTVYLNAKHNLVCAVDKFRPPKAWKDIEAELHPHLSEDQLRGVLAIRQLSLLRTQLKSDLAIFGQTYTRGLARHEWRFLTKSGINPYAKPWSQSIVSRRRERALRTAEEGQPLVVPRVARPRGRP